MYAILLAFGIRRLVMLKHLTSYLILFTLILSAACDASPQPKETQPMIPTTFKCTFEKDNNPPLDPEADKYYQQAVALTKTNGWEDWPQIIMLYEKAIEKDHWKAMYNLASHYKTGEYGRNDEVDHPTAVKKDINKMLALHFRMVELGVPLGYYTWSQDIRHGYVKGSGSKEAALYFNKAVELGYPLALVGMGNHYAFGLPKGSQRDDIAEQYFKCAGAQDNTKALNEVAAFYKIAKENMPLAAFYYQKAASLGDSTGIMVMAGMFNENPSSTYNFGYEPNQQLHELYEAMYEQVRNDRDVKFPNLQKEHPLPRHPVQGYNADNPEVRPE